MIGGRAAARRETGGDWLAGAKGEAGRERERDVNCREREAGLAGRHGRQEPMVCTCPGR